MTVDMKAFILAGEPGKRWFNSIPRHLLNIAGEPLINRTIRQLRECGAQPVLVAPKHTWDLLAVSDGSVPCVESVKGPQSEGVFRLRELWRDSSRVAILLGDTCFSDAVMDRIVANNKKTPASFFGRLTEMYAFTFQASEYDAIESAARRAIPYNVWKIYRAYFGLANLHEPVFDSAGLFQLVPDGDYTDDFDTYQNYQEWLKINAWAKYDHFLERESCEGLHSP